MVFVCKVGEENVKNSELKVQRRLFVVKKCQKFSEKCLNSKKGKISKNTKIKNKNDWQTATHDNISIMLINFMMK